jgi:hypothetical protein
VLILDKSNSTLVEKPLDHTPADPPEDIGPEDDGDGDPIRWITIATFWQSTQAHIARLKLESEEIDCIIVDENLIAMDWLLANAAGGIKLQVPEEQAARAFQLLQTETQSNQNPISDEPITTAWNDAPPVGQKISTARIFRASWH